MINGRTNEREQDLLNIIDRLVDNLQETNTANTEMLGSVNESLIKITQNIPEIKTISENVNQLGGKELIGEVRSISTRLKIFTAVLSILLTLGTFSLAYIQRDNQNSIINTLVSKMTLMVSDSEERLKAQLNRVISNQEKYLIDRQLKK